MRRPGPGPRGGRCDPGGAGARGAGGIIDHPAAPPAGPGARPEPHTRA